jgi:hypothetical protein
MRLARAVCERPADQDVALFDDRTVPPDGGRLSGLSLAVREPGRKGSVYSTVKAVRIPS